MTDYLSRHPTELQGASLTAELLWNERFSVNCVVSLKDVLEDREASSQSSQVSQIKQIKREAKERNIGATACCAWPRAETCNGWQKVLKIVYIPDSKT